MLSQWAPAIIALSTTMRARMRIFGVLVRAMRVMLTAWAWITTTRMHTWATAERIMQARFVVFEIDAYAFFCGFGHVN